MLKSRCFEKLSLWRILWKFCQADDFSLVLKIFFNLTKSINISTDRFGRFLRKDFSNILLPSWIFCRWPFDYITCQKKSTEKQTFLTSVFAVYEPAKFAILFQELYVALEWIFDQLVRLLECKLGCKVIYKLLGTFQNSLLLSNLDQITKASETGDNQRQEGAAGGRNAVRAERRWPFRRSVSACLNQHLNLIGTGHRNISREGKDGSACLLASSSCYQLIKKILNETSVKSGCCHRMSAMLWF